MKLTLDLALKKGIEAHKAGKAQEADRFYTAILKANPKHADANHNMGVLAVDLGKLQQALPFFKTALETNPSIEQFWLSYINALIKLDRMTDAKAIYNQAKNRGLKGNRFDRLAKTLGSSQFKIVNIQDPPKEKLEPLFSLYRQQKLEQVLNKAQKLTKRYTKSLTLWNLIGASAAQVGKLDEAVLSFKRAILIKPDYAEAHYNMGNALKEQGKLTEAIKAYKSALSIKPDYAEAHLNIGNALKEQGKLTEAIKAYKSALSIKPDYAEAYVNMGNALTDQKKLEKGIELYNKALSLTPDNAEAYNNKGAALYEQERIEEAIEAYKRALSIKPDYAEAYVNMGNALTDLTNQEKLEEAIKFYNKALSITPDDAVIYNNKGVTLQQQAKLNEAIEAYTKALSIKPDYDDAHTNLGFLRLFQGDLEGALEHRKWRWTSKEGQKNISNLKLPEWDGQEPLKGKRVLALGEQGPGDIIMWSPGLDYLKNLGCQVTLECHAKLIELFKMSFTDIEIKPIDTKKTIGTDDYDYYIPMETLFGYFCISEQKRDKTLNFAAPAQLKTDPFLFPKQERIDFWKDRLNKIGKGPFVGISWKSPKITYARKKNYTEISDWEPLFSLPNITLINLQSKAFEEDLLKIKEKYSVNVHNFDDLDHYDDLADVAALCAALDVCVSVSTAVSTVAGAVGTPTKMLHWRRSSWNNVLFTPPGPNVKIYEKDTWESWDKCLNSVVIDLKRLENHE